MPHSFAGVVCNLDLSIEPETYSEAMTSPESEKWRSAMEDKYMSLLKNKTWILADLPPGRKAIKCKWVYKLKTNQNGTIAKFKARLVAKGFTQIHGVDFDQTFSPVVKYESIRAILAFVAHLDMEMVQFDIRTAFLYGSLEEEIYMHQPLGYASKDPTKYLRLL